MTSNLFAKSELPGEVPLIPSAIDEIDFSTSSTVSNTSNLSSYDKLGD